MPSYEKNYDAVAPPPDRPQTGAVTDLMEHKKVSPGTWPREVVSPTTNILLNLPSEQMLASPYQLHQETSTSM